MLKNGLNIKKKLAQPAPKLAAFAFDEDENELSEEQAPRTNRAKAPASSLKHSSIDENDEIYDYDGLYDSMKVNELELAKEKVREKAERKPKYMQNLLEMAEVRKRDRLRAEDTKLQREREAEGDEYADKDKFVTSAYKAQQEEVRRIAAQEAAKEAADRANGGGFSAFNQSILKNDLIKREAAVKASLNAQRTESSVSEQRTKSDLDKAREAEAKGLQVALNDDNQVVDHRQLLGAGLNRPVGRKSDQSTHDRPSMPKPARDHKEHEDRKAQLARQQRMLSDQLRDSRKRELELEEAKQAAILEQSKRTKTASDVSSARERYLARKAAEKGLD